MSTESKDVAGTVFGYWDDEDVTYEETWHIRPKCLSQENSGVWDAVRHYMRKATPTDYICLVHPTSPCLKAETVRFAFEEMIEHEDVYDALVSVSKSSPYSWSSADIPRLPATEGTQFMAPCFELNNAIYMAKWGKLLSVKSGYELHWMPFMISADEAIDIDYETDLQMAEAILQWRQKNEKAGKPASTNL